MKLNINWGKTILTVIDVILGIYLVIAVTSWNRPSEDAVMCTKVEINIEDENENGFLKTAEVKLLLERKGIYPLSKHVDEISTREIEDVLCNTAFVKTAECYVDQNGHVCISLTQRTPIIRVKADNGDDFYIDDNGGVMPNSQYTSDMIIATGAISRSFACQYLSIVAECIMADDLWRNQIEQVNVLHDGTLEIVPRVGEHIVNLGELPKHKDAEQRKEKVSEYVKHQLKRLELFYKHGLSVAGWNKYSYISLEFANQVICTRPDKHEKIYVPPTPKKEEEGNQPENAQQSAVSELGQQVDKVKKPETDKSKTGAQKPDAKVEKQPASPQKGDEKTSSSQKKTEKKK